MAGSSSTPPPPSFIGYPYQYYFAGCFPAPAYGMGARGELMVMVSGGPPENAAAWTAVAEPGHWFYVPPWSEQSSGTIIINSAAAAGGVTGIIATQSSSTGTGVFLPEPRICMVPKVQQPTPLVPERDVKAPTEAGGKYSKPEPKTSTTDAGKGKEIQMSYAAAVKGGPSNAAIMGTADPSHAAVKEGPSQPGQRFHRKKKEAMAAVETPVLEKEEEEATAPTVDDIPELALLPDEWVY